MLALKTLLEEPSDTDKFDQFDEKVVFRTDLYFLLHQKGFNYCNKVFLNYYLMWERNEEKFLIRELGHTKKEIEELRKKMNGWFIYWSIVNESLIIHWIFAERNDPPSTLHQKGFLTADGDSKLRWWIFLIFFYAFNWKKNNLKTKKLFWTNKSVWRKESHL